MKPLLSIVVPTKDRYKYLKHFISLIESFNSNEIELVIQDNTADNKEILDFLNQKENTAIKYYHIKEQLAISYNCDLAILHSSGEYVCMMGDDDGVTSHIIDCVSWMKQNEIDVLRSAYALYKWPDYNHEIYNLSGTLSYKNFSKKSVIINTNKALHRLMKKGFKDLIDMPKVYNGIVKRDVLDKIYKINETYFPGPSPDMANAVALCFVVGKTVNIDFPIIIGGLCGTSGGNVKRYKRLVGKIEDQPFLPLNSKENWEKKVPKVWASQTVWPESAIKALRYMGQEKFINNIDFDYMLANFIVYHSELWKLGFNLSENKINLFYFCIKLLTERYLNALQRIIKMKFMGKLNNMKIIYNLSNIELANKYLKTLEPKFIIEDLK